MGDDSVFKMSFASDAYFYKGLEGLIGPPHPLLGEAIKREVRAEPPKPHHTCQPLTTTHHSPQHCEAQDSREPFKTFNYEIETCPEWEWWFVADPEPGLEKFKFTEYPREQKGSYERKPLKPSEFEAKRAKVSDTELRLEQRELPHDSPPASSLCR